MLESMILILSLLSDVSFTGCLIVFETVWVCCAVLCYAVTVCMCQRRAIAEYIECLSEYGSADG
jgi:hypothetical protein